MIKQTYYCLSIVLCLFSGPNYAANLPIDDATAKRLTELIQVALTYDLYNVRCRGFVSSQHMDNMETMTVNKFRMTTPQLVETLMLQSEDSLEQQLTLHLGSEISRLGGLQGLKEKRPSEATEAPLSSALRLACRLPLTKES